MLYFDAVNGTLEYLICTIDFCIVVKLCPYINIEVYRRLARMFGRCAVFIECGFFYITEKQPIIFIPTLKQSANIVPISSLTRHAKVCH